MQKVRLRNNSKGEIVEEKQEQKQEGEDLHIFEWGEKEKMAPIYNFLYMYTYDQCF